MDWIFYFCLINNLKNNIMKLNRLLIVGLSALVIMACRREGCTDQTATNYDKKAKNDDGSCIYGNGDPNNPNNPNQTLPINLTGTESADITIGYVGGSPNQVQYYIDGSWNINSNVTVEPGVRIEMRSDATITIGPDGSLNATGTTSKPIRVLGKNDEYGYWKGINFKSNNSNNKLIHCIIANGSNATWTAGMVGLTSNAKVQIQNSTFTKGSEFGISLDNVACQLPNFENNILDDFKKAPMQMYTEQANFLDNSTDYGSSSIKNFIYVHGDIETAITINKLNVPYYVNGSISINEGNTTINAGTKLVMGANVNLEVSVNGSLTFAGNSSNRCSVTGDDHSQGYWKYIYIKSNNSQNVFSYTDFSDGGTGTWGNGAISLSSSSKLSMNNCTVKNCSNIAVDGTGTFVDGGGNSWSGCPGGGGNLP